MTTPTVSVTDNNPSVGGNQGLVFTATVTPPNGDPGPAGLVTWSITFTTTGPAVPVGCTTQSTSPTFQGNKALWTCTINPALAGTWSATANFAADTNYTAATSLPDIQIVPKVNPNLNMPNPTAATTLVFTFTVTGTGTGINAVPPTGTVTWSGSPCTSMSQTSSGVMITATCTITPASSSTTYGVTATYPGDTNYTGGFKSASAKGSGP